MHDDVAIWFCRALQPYEMEISQYNNMDRVWDTGSCLGHFQVLSLAFGEHIQGQGHEVNERSDWKFCSGRHVFRSVFREEREKLP